MWFVGQFVMLPATTFLYGIELLVNVMREMQKATTEGMRVIAGSGSQSPHLAQENVSNPIFPQPEIPKTIEPTQFVPGDTNEIRTKEEGPLNNNGGYSNGVDKDLNDDMLKLVRYKILFVKRDFEYAFPEQEELVFDNISGADFTAWKIAEFIQKIGRCKNENEPDRVRIPEKWRTKKYPRRYSAPKSGDWSDIERLENDAKDKRKLAEQTKDPKDVKAAQEAEARYEKRNEEDPPHYLVGFPEEDKKFLKLFFQVLERYPREKFKHDERQIEVLEQIRDRLPG